MTELAEGHKAPDFTLPGDDGSALSLSALAGKPVVLYFYPQDDTETCTAEAIAFTRLLPDFEAAGAIVIGVSPDSIRKHGKFKTKHKLLHSLAADESLETVKAYGVWGEKTTFGRTYIGVERSTFLIAADGRIARIWRKVRVNGHAEAVLAAVRDLPAA
jgi:thioredoxin-dependent peroxiredoxin